MCIKVSAIDLSWNTIKEPRTIKIEDIAFRTDFTNGDTNIKIGGNNSITGRADVLLADLGGERLNAGSKIIFSATYQLPLLRIVKTDSALFEVVHDANGSPMWVKKPLSKYVNYEATTVFIIPNGVIF